MLTWLRSLVAEWSGMRRSDVDTEVENATGAGDGATGTTDTDRTDGGAANGRAPPGRDGRPLEQQFPLELPVSKVEVYRTLGFRPPEFLVWLVEEDGGRMWQVDLVETTGWSKSAMSRSLCSLESDGTLERVQVGRRKLVCVPGELPALVSNDDWPDAPRV